MNTITIDSAVVRDEDTARLIAKGYEKIGETTIFLRGVFQKMVELRRVLRKDEARILAGERVETTPVYDFPTEI